MVLSLCVGIMATKTEGTDNQTFVFGRLHEQQCSLFLFSDVPCFFAAVIVTAKMVYQKIPYPALLRELDISTINMLYYT